MAGKIKCGVLGATGIVGQNYIKLLQDHPWFEVVDLAASERSAGKPYSEAVANRWHMDTPIPEAMRDLEVREVQDYDSIDEGLKFVFSAVNMPTKEELKAVELEYARRGIPVVSNNSAHRWTPDVPMLIGEINPGHADIIPVQKEKRGFSTGFIVVKPNCSLQSYLTPIYALERAGYKVEQLIVTTLQAVSGAGHPGVSSFDITDNIIPYIGGEEEKTEREPHKILGKVEGGEIVPDESIAISATCTRVGVIDGHTAVVNLKFKEEPPAREEVLKTWREFRSTPQELALPFAPSPPIVYLEENDRPQPRKDRDNGKGMAVTVGRLREDNVFHFKFVALSHNTIRGAAGGGILNAELLKEKGYFDF
ncbi:MAG: aspartate-semialdehyde dehydrogenase [Promethearchaeota archaeon]